MHPGDTFRLISRTIIFRVTREYMAAGFIPSVIGVSLDGKLSTCARIVDVVLVPESTK